MSFGLDQKTIDDIRSVFGRYSEIEKVLIYGSRAKGNYRKGSDIDLTLIGNDITDSLLAKVLRDLDDLNLPYLMDVSIFDRLRSPELEAHIQRVGRLFYPG